MALTKTLALELTKQIGRKSSFECLAEYRYTLREIHRGASHTEHCAHVADFHHAMYLMHTKIVGETDLKLARLGVPYGAIATAA